MIQKPPPLLRDQVLDLLYASGEDANLVAQAVADVLCVVLVAASPNIAAAERNIALIANDMSRNLPRSYREYHAMREAQQQAHKQ